MIQLVVCSLDGRCILRGAGYLDTTTLVYLVHQENLKILNWT